MMTRQFYVMADPTGAIEGWGMCEASVFPQQAGVLAPRQCAAVSEQDYLAVAASPADYRLLDGALVRHA